MKLLLPLIVVSTLASAPPDADPECAVSITLPQSALEMRVEYRQVGGDQARFLEPGGMSPVDFHQLQVQSLLAQGGRLSTDVPLRAGDHDFAAGRYPLGYTLGAGGAVHLFLVDGQDAIALPGEPVEPGWESPRFALQLVYVDRSEVRLLWHLADKAGSIKLALGGAADDEPRPPETPPRDDPPPAPTPAPNAPPTPAPTPRPGPDPAGPGDPKAAGASAGPSGQPPLGG